MTGIVADNCRSFPPLINCQTRLMIIGSMPGIRSLEMNQYYAHSRNLFWPLMATLAAESSAVLNSDIQLIPYQQRINWLKSAGIGLWDVLANCERAGSLDSAINTNTALPNDFNWLLSKYPAVKTLCFNGNTALKLFKKLVLPQLTVEIKNQIQIIPLPSTSPANAGIPYQIKFARWSIITEIT